jgi:hypothetical protein
MRYNVGRLRVRSEKMKETNMVKCGVKDRMTGEIVYKTRKAFYRDAHARAEKKARSLGCGDRFAIVEL